MDTRRSTAAPDESSAAAPPDDGADRPAAASASPGRAGLRAAVHSEWTKLRTLRSTWWLLTASVVLMAAVCVLVALSAAASSANGYDVSTSAAQVAIQAMMLAQLPLVALAGLAITGEYASGAIGTTLRVTPLRGRMLAAKTAVATAVAVLGGAVLVLFGTAVAALVIGPGGSMDASEIGRAAGGAAVYLGSLAILVVGVGAAARSTAGTLLGAVLLLLVAPTVLDMSGVAWLMEASELLPGSAGSMLMTEDIGHLGYGPAVAATVLGTWALLGQLVGYASLWSRDA